MYFLSLFVSLCDFAYFCVQFNFLLLVKVGFVVVCSYVVC